MGAPARAEGIVWRAPALQTLRVADRSHAQYRTPPITPPQNTPNTAYVFSPTFLRAHVASSVILRAETMREKNARLSKKGCARASFAAFRGRLRFSSGNTLLVAPNV